MPGVAYLITLTTRAMESLDSQMRTELRLTKVLVEDEDSALDRSTGPAIALVVRESRDAAGRRDRWLEWMGSAARLNSPGQGDRSVTIDPLRECFQAVPLDGPDGLLAPLPTDLRAVFDAAGRAGFAGYVPGVVWRALEEEIRKRFTSLAPVLDWLLAQASPVFLDSSDAAQSGWQEQRDALRHVLRIADFPTTSLNTWKLPASGDDPYTAGIVPDPSLSGPPQSRPSEPSALELLLPSPSENSMIEFDVRHAAQAFGMTSDWVEQNEARCDINVLWDASGRRLDIANVNALGVERRTGTDLIYYHYPTQSIVLVQYKRLKERSSRIKVNAQLRDQLARLKQVNELSRTAAHPREWRLGRDASFLLGVRGSQVQILSSRQRFSQVRGRFRRKAGAAFFTWWSQCGREQSFTWPRLMRSRGV